MADMSGRFLAANLQTARMHGFESAEDLVSRVRLGQDLVGPGSREGCGRRSAGCCAKVWCRGCG